MLQLILTLAVIAAFLGAAERVDPEAGVRTRPDPVQRRIDLYWMGAYVFYAPIVGWVAAGVIRTAAGAAPLAPQLATLPWILRLAGAVIVAELVAYSLHRMMHTVPMLWHVHAVHHGATDLRWWTAFRFHPAETVLTHVAPYAAAALVGFGSDVTAVQVAAVTVVTMFSHADVYVPGRWSAALVVTPGYHRSHHEFGRGHTNFALALPLIDVLFGTAAFDDAGPRRFGHAETTPQTASNALPASDVTLASELEVRPTMPLRIRRPMIHASNTSTPTSTAASAGVRPMR